jgi:hypothetical protein
MKRIGRPCGFPVSTTWRCTPPPPATLWVFIMILVSADTAADRLATPSRAAINCYWIDQEPTCIKSSYTRVGRRTGLPSYIGGRFWEVMWRGGAVRRLRVNALVVEPSTQTVRYTNIATDAMPRELSLLQSAHEARQIRSNWARAQTKKYIRLRKITFDHPPLLLLRPNSLTGIFRP